MARRRLWPELETPAASPQHPAPEGRHPLPAATPAESFQLFNEHLAASRGHMDRIGEALRSLNRGPRVLETRTLTIPAAAQEQPGTMTAGAPGVWVGDRYRIPFAAVAVFNPTNAPLIVSTGPPQGSAPGGGQGQAIVPATSFAAWNMAGSQLSIYGTPGATLTISVFADAVMPIVADWGSNGLMPGGNGLGNTLQTLQAHGSSTGPGAGGVIAQITPANGLIIGMQYQITAIAYMSGTTASPTDDDNMRIAINANTQAFIPMSGAASPGPGVQPVTVTVPVSQGWNGISNINLVANAAATATAVYHGTLLATPLVPAA